MLSSRNRRLALASSALALAFTLLVVLAMADPAPPAAATLGGMSWTVHADRPGDFWLAAKDGPDGGPALIGRAFPGKQGRWVSDVVPVTAARAYVFSARIESELVSAEAHLVISFRDAAGKQVGSAASPTIFWHFGWANWSAVGVAPAKASKAALVLQVSGTQGTSAGQVLMADPTFGPTVALQAALGVEANVLEVGQKTTLTVALQGAPPKVPVTVNWRARDFNGRAVGGFYGRATRTADGKLTFPLRPFTAGYYTIHIDATGQGLKPASTVISLGALGPLKPWPPSDSRMCLDAGMSWGPASNLTVLNRACYVCQKAGLRELRDRLSWGAVEPKPGTFHWGQYAQAAEAEHSHGITVYQIFHDCPPWAVVKTADGQYHHNMPPRDPIAVYHLVYNMVKDLGHDIRYFEVWNEANIGFFCGRPEDYAGVLKAAYLGAKDADPRFGVLLCSAAGTPGPFFDQVYENNAAPYFNIYNQHWYGSPEALFSFLASVRAQQKSHGIVGRPAWITEMGMRAHPDESGSFVPVERDQASYLARAYACAFANGIRRFHYFYLQNFLEGSVSLWGIVRDDQTPKPTYVALATLIRQLGECRCLGYKQLDGGYMVVFQRAPGDDVAMVWGKEGQHLNLPASGPVVSVVGAQLRPAVKGDSLTLDVGPMPVYVRGIADSNVASLGLKPPVPDPAWKPAPDPNLAAKQVWVQVTINPDQPRPFWNGEDRLGAFITPGKPFTAAAYVNNYTNKPVTATVTCHPDRDLTLQGPATAEVEVKPWSRARHDFTLVGHDLLKGKPVACIIDMTAPGGHKDHAEAHFQATSSDVKLTSPVSLFAGAADMDAWSENHSPSLKATLTADKTVEHGGQASLRVDATVVSSGDCWDFPRLRVPAGVNLADYKALEFWTYVAPGKEFQGHIDVQFVEQNGGTYIVSGVRRCTKSGWQREVVPIDAAQATAWAPDPDHKFDPSKVRTLLIGWGGYSGRLGEKLTYWVNDVRAGKW